MMRKPVRDPVLGALDMDIFKVLEAAWDDPSPRNVEQVKQLITTHGGLFIICPEFLEWIRRHKREIDWIADALAGKLSP